MENKILFKDVPTANARTEGYEIISKIINKKKIKNILYISPPDMHAENFSLNKAQNYNYWNYAPYGLGVLAANLSDKYYKNYILNLNHFILKEANLFQGKNFPFDKLVSTKLQNTIEEFKPDFIVITCMFSQTHKSLQDVVKIIKKKSPNALIAIGGVHVTNALVDSKTSVNFIKELKEVDFYFLYEGDNTLPNFINFVNDKLLKNEYLPSQLFAKNKNIVYRFNDRDLPLVQKISLPPRHDLMNTDELSKYGKIGSFYCHIPKNTKIVQINKYLYLMPI